MWGRVRSRGVFTAGQAFACPGEGRLQCGLQAPGTALLPVGMAASHHHVEAPAFPKTSVPVSVSPGHSSVVISGEHLVDIHKMFEIHKSFCHRKLDPTMFSVERAWLC